MALTSQVRDFVYDHESRKRYVATATDYLRGKRPALDKTYDVILVGAGIHAALFLYTIRRTMPDLSVLVVEKSMDICSTFARLGDSLILNSPTSSKVGLNANVAPGHFVQVSDFDELSDRPFPTAKHLHELATMVFFHADADVVFDFGVDDVNRGDGEYTLSSDDRTATSKAVIIANGMGQPRDNSFRQDRPSARVIPGDSFIADCYEDEGFVDGLKDLTVAVIGGGDTANCVMEYLLPLTYPQRKYGWGYSGSFAPASVIWIGQGCENIQQYYFANKQRYCHSGGLVEFFWDGDAPFDLPADAWRRAKSRITCMPERLDSVCHTTESLELVVSGERLEVDIAVDCTGRVNPLSSLLLRESYEFIEGDVVLHGGQWVERLERLVAAPRYLPARRVACKLKGERIFLLGSACPLSELVDDEEARDGSLKHEESRTSLTNSKWSLEHTLPRTVAFAEQYAEVLRAFS